MKNEIKRCARCIMDDSSDSTIVFDENGFCNYCTTALAEKERIYFPNEVGAKKIENMVSLLKSENRNKEYDCIMGISGGLDSSYLAYLGSEWGLRILAFHIDDGYDTEISKENIRKLTESCKLKMITITPDALQFNDLTRAYLRARVPNAAVPQDNILFANIYKYALKHKIPHFLTGSNWSLECILQAGNTHPPRDLVNLKDIHKKFGEQPINKLTFTSFSRIALQQKLLGLRIIAPLNYIDYTRDCSFTELKAFCGFEYYGRKHLENYLTEFIQTYWFPKMFGVDKRTSHLSSMIVSGQMTREEALQELALPLYNEEHMAKLIPMILDRIQMSHEEFESILKQSGCPHTDYAVSKFPHFVKKVRQVLGR